MKHDNYQCEYKKLIRCRTCEEDYVWNSSTCTFEHDEDCDIGEYLKDWEYMKIVDDLVLTCNEIEDAPKI